MFYSMNTPAARRATLQMRHAGFTASIMKAPRLVDDGRKHRLPPGEAIPVFPVSSLPGCPREWLRDGGFVCPVATNWGIWFDWRSNDNLNTAVIPSVKGMNPITGRAVTSPHMESYETKCPVHDIPFSHGLFCEKCGYEWPPQNYLTNDSGHLWWDGFRQPDGTVRQFFFSEDDKKDIASLVIGKENTAPAFGFVFYEPQVRREPARACAADWIICPGITHPAKNPYDVYVGDAPPLFHYTYTANDSGDKLLSVSSISCNAKDATCYSANASYTSNSSSDAEDALAGAMFAVQQLKGKSTRKREEVFRSAVRSVSVGAGAEILQELAKDSLGIDKWKESPSSIIRLYFCFEEQFRDIVASGVEDPVSETGFLAKLPVG